MNGPCVRVTARQALERLLDVLEERGRQPSRRYRAEGIAVQAGVLGGDPALLAADPHPHRAPALLELAEDAAGRHGIEAARLGVVLGQIADRSQHVVEAVGVGGARALARPLQVGLDLRECARVDQLAQLLCLSSSRNRSRSSDSAAARRSALGVSPSYM